MDGSICHCCPREPSRDSGFSAEALERMEETVERTTRAIKEKWGYLLDQDQDLELKDYREKC